jgi:hypothetical protein
MKTSRLFSTNDAKAKIESGESTARKLMDSYGKSKSSIIPSMRVGPRPPEEHARIMRDISARSLRNIDASNAQLRVMDNKNGIPLHQREYLDKAPWEQIFKTHGGEL